MGRINKALDANVYDDAKTWDLPSVDDPTPFEDGKTNALNRPNTWKYEAPEETVEEDIQPLTAEDIEAIRQSAYEEGFKLGHREGHDKGFEEGLESGREQGVEEGSKQGLASAQEQINEQIVKQTQQWQAMLDGAAQPLKSINTEVEKELMILSVKLAEAVIGLETTQSEDVLLKAISEGIKALPINEQSFQFHMNPDDIGLVVEHFGQETIVKNNWQLVESPAMQRGGCDIATSNNAVDLSIERRSKDVFTRFLSEQGLSNDPRLT